MRLGRVPVGGLQRDEAVEHAVAFEAMREAAVALAGGHAEQPAIGGQRVEQVGNPVVQRLLDLPAPRIAMNASL